MTRTSPQDAQGAGEDAHTQREDARQHAEGAAVGAETSAAAPVGRRVMPPDTSSCGCGKKWVKRTGSVERDGIVHRHGLHCYRAGETSGKGVV